MRIEKGRERRECIQNYCTRIEKDIRAANGNSLPVIEELIVVLATSDRYTRRGEWMRVWFLTGKKYRDIEGDG